MAQAAFWKADWFIGLSVLLMLLLVGLVLLAAKRLGKMGGNKEKQPAESAEAKRMLGLAFHGQGQLDKAFDKFRECPMSEGLMENIYNLALDYERQRQFKNPRRFSATCRHTIQDSVICRRDLGRSWTARWRWALMNRLKCRGLATTCWKKNSARVQWVSFIWGATARTTD